MPSLTNFLTDKTSTFKYKIVKQHYLELWTKQAHSLKEGKLRTYLKIKTNVLSVKKLVKLGIFCKICFTEPYHDGCLPSYTFLVHLYAALRSGKEGKLRTYLKIKNNFGYENYLSIIKYFE
jgi:hypothetical protein